MRLSETVEQVKNLRSEVLALQEVVDRALEGVGAVILLLTDIKFEVKVLENNPDPAISDRARSIDQYVTDALKLLRGA